MLPALTGEIGGIHSKQGFSELSELITDNFLFLVSSAYSAVKRNEEDVFLRVCLSEYDTRIRGPFGASEPVSDVKDKNT